MAGETLRRNAARSAIAIPTNTASIAGLTTTLRIGIRTIRNVPAVPIDKACFCRRASDARPAAHLIAADAIDAMPREAVRVDSACRAIPKNALAGGAAIAIRALVVRIGIGFYRSACAIGATSFLRSGTRLTQSAASIIATNAIGAERRCALAAIQTYRTIARHRAPHGTTARATGAFYLRIRTRSNVVARAVGATAF